MRFVAVKSTETQALLMQHKTRDLLVRHRTALINALRGHLAEFGIVTPKGSMGVREALSALQAEENDIPDVAREAFGHISSQLEELDVKIAKLDRSIVAWCRNDVNARRLMTIPGVGPLTASALSSSVGDVSAFKSGRQFAAWLGLTPRQNSSGGKERLGRISKQGDRNVRRLLVVGATALLRLARNKPAAFPWIVQLLGRKSARLASVAIANKTARIAWALLQRQETYRAITA